MEGIKLNKQYNIFTNIISINIQGLDRTRYKSSQNTKELGKVQFMHNMNVNALKEPRRDKNERKHMPITHC